MTGWLRVAADHVRTKRQLAKWVAIGTSYARSLPVKKKQRRGQRPRRSGRGPTRGAEPG